MIRFFALLLLASGTLASYGYAQTPGNLTLNSLQLIANGKTLIVQAPPTLSADQTLQLPDLSGIGGPVNFIMTESSTMQTINTGGLQVLGSGIRTSGLTLMHSTANADIQFNVAQRPTIYPAGSNVPPNLNLQVRSAGSGILQLNYDNNGPIELGSQNGNTVQISSSGGTTRIGNLTTNGIVQTGGGNGTLSIATEGAGYLATVRHDATLSGNGTTASNLSLNLGNGNTWTGAQTFNAVTLGGSLNANSQRIINVPAIPTAGTDAINSDYVLTTAALKNGDATTNFQTDDLTVNGNFVVLNLVDFSNADFTMGGARIKEVSNPFTGTDAANRNYVDVMTGGPSDVRFKQEITSASVGLKEVEQMNPVTYYYRNTDFPGRAFPTNHQIGFIAQEMEKLIPQVVRTDQEGYKMIDYGHLTPVLVNAIKEQQHMIEAQQQQLELKEQELLHMKSELSLMKNEMEAVKLAITKLTRNEHPEARSIKTSSN